MKNLLFGKDWKTSLAGLATAGLLYAKTSGVQLVDWKSAALSLGVYAIGRLASDGTTEKK